MNSGTGDNIILNSEEAKAIKGLYDYIVEHTKEPHGIKTIHVLFWMSEIRDAVTTATDNNEDPKYVFYNQTEDFKILIQRQFIWTPGPEAPPDLLSNLRRYAEDFIRAYYVPKKTENLPTSAPLDMITEALMYGKNIDNLPDRRKGVSNSASYEVMVDQKNDRHIKIVRTTENSLFSVEILDINELNKDASKLFIFLLMEINKQAVDNGIIIHDRIFFPVKDLIKSGLYNSERAAKRGFDNGITALRHIDIHGYTTTGKGKQRNFKRIDNDGFIYGGQIKKNICTVKFNNEIDWSNFAPYLSLMPTYYFKLSNRPAYLLYYIFYLARQRTKEIEKNGFFTISYKSIAARLNLPAPSETSHPQRDIIDEIDKALEAIEEENKNFFTDGQFNLLPMPPEPQEGKNRISASDYLNRGKLKVYLSGELSEKFVKLNKKRDKKIKAAETKQRRIKEKAAALSMAKKTQEEAAEPPANK